MSNDKDWRPRLSIDLTPEQAVALKRLIPFGFQKRVFRVLIDMLVQGLEENGIEMLKSVLEYEINLPKMLLRQKEN